MSANHPLLENVTALPTRPRNELCPHCGAKQVEYVHNLNANLAEALYALYKFGRPARLRDLNLSFAHKNNLQKLQYWNLIRHLGSHDSKTTYWQITDRGFLFLGNALAIPKKVWTYRGEFRRYEGEEVLISQLVKNYDWQIDYARERRVV